MKGNWTVVEAMRYARHDWMNQLQLLKGNMTLQKWERVQAIMDDLIVQAQQDSRLTNLGKPKFAERLLTFNWENHSFQIEWEILEEGYTLNMEDEELVTSFNEWFSFINENAKPYGENQLFIRLQKEESTYVFSFEYMGEWKADVTEWLNNWCSNSPTNHSAKVIQQDNEQFLVHWYV